MEANLAVPAKSPEKDSPDGSEPGFTPIQLKVAELLGRSMSRSDIVDRLQPQILSTFQKRNYSKRKQRLAALRRIRVWQRSKSFRDLVYQYTMDELDSRTPEIVNGVANRAANGRVDAAKLALELSGRYTPRGAEAPTAVQIVVNGVPRPPAVVAGSEVVDGAVLLEEDEA